MTWDDPANKRTSGSTHRLAKRTQYEIERHPDEHVVAASLHDQSVLITGQLIEYRQAKFYKCGFTNDLTLWVGQVG